MNGTQPLDRSTVHPEAYPVVERMAAHTGRKVAQLLGDAAFLKSLRPADYTDDRFGLPTVMDILRELDKPGRDPRPEFKTATFAEGVEQLSDLRVGMVLEGVVTNVTNFGAFVDVGVHQDGLVHISALSKTFVDDPRKVVKAGDLVKAKVMEVDVKRKRIALSLRLDDEPGTAAVRSAPPREAPPTGGRPAARREGGKASSKDTAPANNAMAEALAKLRR